jgi:N,N'-diacetyllegionaminate synthase
MSASAPAHVFVIAEAGVNHNGSVEMALELVDAAAAQGADAVKFQSFRAAALAAPDAPRAAYQQETTGEAGGQLAMLRALELSPDGHRRIAAHCRQRGIEFLSSPFDAESVELLATLELKRLKVPSGELLDVPYLRRVAALGLPLIVSTGMATLSEVDAALGVLEAAGCPRARITVLHCSTEYPTPPADVNLRAMITLRDSLGVAVGYSDHTEGITVAVAAAALGATVVEKHLTLDRALPGPDHRASLEPGEFGDLVRAVRLVEAALGDGVKAPTAGELENIPAARKSIVAARAIAAGATLGADDLAVKRPGTGMTPLRWDDVLGLTASRDYRADELIDEPLP